jgi:uncharacterized protein YjdB
VPESTVITISDLPPVIEVGERFTLTASVRRRDASEVPDARVAWSSRDRAIATIDSSTGLVTPVAPGTTTIVASFAAARGEVSLTVAAAAATVVNISLPPEPLYVGESVQMTSVVQNKRGTPLPLAPAWSSSDERIATISRTGVLTAHAPGSVRISAQAGAVNGSVVLWVSPVTVEALRLVTPPESLVIGESFRLSAAALDARDARLSDRTIAWSSSDRAVATVSPAGVVTAHGSGPVTITAACDGVSASTTLTVVEPPVASVSIAAPPRQILIGNVFRLVATPLDAHGRPLKRSIEWRSSDEDVASISADGIVTPNRAGSATITAVAEGMEGAVRFSVNRLTQPVGIRALVGGFVSPRKLTTAGSAFVASTRQKLGAAAAAAGATSRRQLGTVRRAVPALSGRTWAIAGGAVAVVAIVGVVLAGTVGKGSTDRAVAPDTAAVTVSTSTGASDVPSRLPVATLALSPVPTLISVGDTFSVTATPLGAAQEQLEGRAVRWSSSDTSVAAVGETTGVVTTYAAGHTVISVESEGSRDSLPIEVHAKSGGSRAIGSITITKPGALHVGEMVPLRASVAAAGGGSPSASDLTWSSSNAKVVAIDAKRGVMRGAGVGVAMVSAGFGSTRSTITVVVLSSDVATVAIATPRPMTMGEALTFSAKPLDGSGKELPGKTVAWASSDGSVATIDPRSGVVTAHNTGTAVITARVDGVTGRTVLLVTSGAPVATPVELVRRQVAEFVAALRNKNLARVEELLTPADGGESQNRAKLLKLLREGKPKFTVGNQTGAPAQIAGDRATASFSVPLSWRTRLGGTKRVVVAFEAELERSTGSWRITRCRILGTPDLD